jgi:trehalose 6-phosphate synthase/phosphatase
MTSNFRFLPLLGDNNQHGNIIHVSHQLPFEISHDQKEDERTTWTFTPRHGHAAMYAGMHSLIDEWEMLCIGWTGQLYERSDRTTEDLNQKEIDQASLSVKEKEALTAQLQREKGCVPLFLDNADIAGHYKGYCKTSKVFPIKRARRRGVNEMVCVFIY